MDFSSPKVMGIINVTPDSFYTSWDELSMENILKQTQEMIDQGVDILDLGAYSTRPNHSSISLEEEWKRLSPVLQAIRSHFPRTVISIDTFRAEIAECAIKMGADIINDVSGGEVDNRIWDVARTYQVPYILTHALEIPTSDYNIMSSMLDFFQSRLDTLHKIGIADVIIDPGFGFGKTEVQNYAILQQMEVLTTLQVPILAGISRKSMLYKALGTTPAEVLPATVAANTIALAHGATILRVHDVAAAKQTIAIYSLTHKNA